MSQSHFYSRSLKRDLFGNLFSTPPQTPAAESPSLSLWHRTKSLTSLLSLAFHADPLHLSSSDTDLPLVEVDDAFTTPINRSAPTTLSRSVSFDLFTEAHSAIDIDDFPLWIMELDNPESRFEIFADITDAVHTDKSPRVFRLQRIASFLKRIVARPEYLISVFAVDGEGEKQSLFGIDLDKVRRLFRHLDRDSGTDLLDSVEKAKLLEALDSGLEILLSKLDSSSKTWKNGGGTGSRINTTFPSKDTSPAVLLREKYGNFYRSKNLSSASVDSLSPPAPSSESTEDMLDNLAPLAVLLECPFLSEYHFAKKVAIIISRLHKSIKVILVKELEVCYRSDAFHFKAQIDHFKSVICSRYQPTSGDSVSPANSSPFNPRDRVIDDGVVACVRVLSLWYNVNELSARIASESSSKHCAVIDGAPLRSIVPFWTFYCTVDPRSVIFVTPNPQANESTSSSCPVISNLPVKQLFFRYLKLYSQPELLATTFSLLNYPFLLDPIQKSRIIRIEALAWMSGEFEDAFVRQGFVGSLKKVIESVGNIARISDPSNSDSGPSESTRAAISRLESAYATSTNPYCVLSVRRHHLLDDTFDQIKMKWLDIHKPFKVKFVGEEGVDQGGVQKEFFQLLFSTVLDPEQGLFTYDEGTRLSWINAFSKKDVGYFKLVGAMLGLSVYNGIMIDVNLPLVFYKKLLYETTNPSDSTFVNLDDLSQLHPQTYRGLQQLINWDSSRGSVEDIFCRTFEVSYENDPEKAVYELLENGSNIEVTESNRELYSKLYARHMLQAIVAKVFQPLRDGFWRVVGGPDYLKMSIESEGRDDIKAMLKMPYAVELFRPEELRAYMTGLGSTSETSSVYSAEAFKVLKEAVRYEDYTEKSAIIQSFWHLVLNDFKDDDRRKLLWFVTASDRIPLGGL
eukprot:Partr_v1_DN27704_c1_g1_i1_m67605 putative HECTc